MSDAREMMAGLERDGGDLVARLRRAAAVYAIERTHFYRDNLARAMRRAVDAGVRREQVIALSVLPREEADGLLPVARGPI